MLPSQVLETFDSPDWVVFDTGLHFYPGRAVVGHFTEDRVIHLHTEGVFPG